MLTIVLLTVALLFTARAAAADYKSAADMLEMCAHPSHKNECGVYMLNTSRELNWPSRAFGLKMVGEQDLSWHACPPGDTTSAWEQAHWIKQIPLFVAKYWVENGTPTVLMNMSAREAILIALIETWPLCNSTGA